MSTSIPKSRKKQVAEKAPVNGGSLDLHLSYEGKKSVEEILSTPPASVTQVWPIKGTNSNTNNRLYFGENMNVLSTLIRDKGVCGKVRLVYIDPPFATGGVFQSRSQQDAYEDLLIGAHYVEFIRERLILLRELLSEDGSIYVHLDKNMAFAVKMVMDEVFGPKNFRSWITRKKCNPKNYTNKTYGNVADFILFYSKSDTYVWNRPTEEWTEARAKEYQYVDEQGRRFMKVPVHAPGTRNGETGMPWRGKLPPPGKHWQYPPSKLDELDAQGHIFWSSNGNPRRKVYLDESQGVPVQDIWLEYRDAHNQNIKITGYPTEKNPQLLERIIKASSNLGDLVLDCFSGSGTTLAVASQLDRQWIGIDNSAEAITTTLKRFAHGTNIMGDFVGKKKKVQQQVLPSFEEHQPITNFTLYTLHDEIMDEEQLTAQNSWQSIFDENNLF